MQVSQMIFIVLACHVDIVQVVYTTWHLSKNTLHGALKDPRCSRDAKTKAMVCKQAFVCVYSHVFARFLVELKLGVCMGKFEFGRFVPT